MSNFAQGAIYLAFRSRNKYALYMPAAKRGRPPSGNQRREVEVSFCLTNQDADYLERTAVALGFRNRGQMLTAIVERLVAAQLAAFAFLKVGWQLAERARETGSSKGTGFWNPFRDPILPFEPAEPRPPSPLPDEDLANPAQTKLLEQVRKQKLA